MSHEPPNRVRSSNAAIACSALLWLLFPVGWPAILWGIGLGVVIAKPLPPDINPSAMVVLLALCAVPAMGSWWVWWRFAGVRAIRQPDGIRLRGFRRTVTVHFSQVTDVSATEFFSAGRAFRFGWTVVTFRPADGGEQRSVRISRSFRSGTAGQRTILSWFPPDHPLHMPFPVPAERGRVDAPVLHTLRPSVLIRVLHCLALVLGPAPLALPAIIAVSQMEPGTGRTVVLALLGAVLLAVLWLMTRIWRSRLYLTARGLVNHGYVRRHDYPLDAVQDFLLVPAGAGSIVSLVLAGEGSRQLTVGAGFGEHSRRVHETLHAWLRDGRAAGDRHGVAAPGGPTR